MSYSFIYNLLSITIPIGGLIFLKYKKERYDKMIDEKIDILYGNTSLIFNQSAGTLADDLKMGILEETGTQDSARTKMRNTFFRLDNLISNSVFFSDTERNTVKEYYSLVELYLAKSQMYEQIHYIKTKQKNINDFDYETLEELKKNYICDYMKKFPHVFKFVKQF